MGKTTIFNALTGAQAKSSNYPFCTIEPNQGVVPVPDERLEKLKEYLGVGEGIPALVEFVDIAGLVKGASEGEGLGNQFLSNIRGVDALLHVVRGFQDPNVSHWQAEIDPIKDIEIVNTELLLSDLEIVERSIARLKFKEEEFKNLLMRVKESLSSGIPIRRLPLSKEEKKRLKSLGLLTGKPVIYLINIGEEKEEKNFAYLKRHTQLNNFPLLFFKGKLEEEITRLPSSEQEEFRKAWGIEESGLKRLLKTCYYTLGLVTFYTIARNKLRAWAIQKGSKMIEGARLIHSDMAKGFIKAEVISFSDLLKFPSYQEAKDKGEIKIVGKDYLIQDGDIVYIHFKV